MLARAERKGLPPDSPFRTELTEVREITHNTLEKMRSLSQMLHPAVLDDYGLAKGIEWYADVFQKQTGIETTAIVEGTPVQSDRSARNQLLPHHAGSFEQRREALGHQKGGSESIVCAGPFDPEHPRFRQRLAFGQEGH